MATTTTTSAASIFSAASNHHHPLHLPSKLLFSSKLPFSSKPPPLPLKPITKLHVQGRTQNFNTEYSSNPITSTTTTTTSKTNPNQETIFFDGGAHYGDLVANLFLGFTLVWLPLTLAACLRAFFLRYRFTNLRVTVVSGLTGQERSDFSYKVIKDVQVVPRFIGEWGDIIITLKDGTKVDLRSVPKFREIAKYCLSMADQPAVVKESGAKGF